MEEIICIAKDVREDIVNNLRTRQILLELKIADKKISRQQAEGFYDSIRYGIWIMDKLGLLDDQNGKELKMKQAKIADRMDAVYVRTYSEERIG